MSKIPEAGTGAGLEGCRRFGSKLDFSVAISSALTMGAKIAFD